MKKRGPRTLEHSVRDKACLLVTCPRCRHSTTVYLLSLIERYGLYKPLGELVFRCERCGTRGQARETLR